MSHDIDHFIWGYQIHFRIGQEIRARSIFRSLDTRFDPEIFVVGILIQDRSDRHRACVEPEDEFWIQSEAFDDVLKRSKDILQTYPEIEVFHSDQSAQRWHEQRLRKKAVRDAISQVIYECACKPDKMRYFTSFPVELDGFLVSLVLGLQGEVLDSYPYLTIDRADIHEYRSFKVPISLIDAVVDEYLEEVAGELLKPIVGAGIGGGKSSDELLRAAGNSFISGAAYKADATLKHAGHWQLLFDAYNRVSSLKYEQTVSSGRIVIAREDHPALRGVVTFKDPTDVLNVKALRKLLELSSSDVALHTNATNVFGLVNVRDYQGETEDLYEVSICGHHAWEFTHAGQTLMRVRAGLPSLRKPSFDTERLQNDLKRIFPGVTSENIRLIISLADEAEKEKRGTMLVVSDHAVTEAQRLLSQSTPLRPRILTAELLHHLTPIDGAVLLGQDGVCHAIGVILDGLATEEGDSSRGARFNSAVRYVESRPDTEACVVIVVSEDGGVDIIPDLRPPIRRSQIEHVFIELKQVLATEHVNRRRYSKAVKWLEDNRFYLLPEHCETANQLIEEIEGRIRAQDPESPSFVRQHFASHPEMDPDLYYTDE